MMRYIVVIGLLVLLFGCTANFSENVEKSRSKLQSCINGDSLRMTKSVTIYFQGWSGDSCSVETNQSESCDYTKDEVDTNDYFRMAGIISQRCNFQNDS